MKTNQKGFSAVETILIVVVVGLIAAVGWLSYDRQNSKTDDSKAASQASKQNKSTKEKPEAADPYKDWKSGSFSLAKLSYKIPSNWQDVSDNSKFKDTSYKYEEVKLVSSDGFTLTMSVNDLPRGFEGPSDYSVLEFKNIDSGNQWIIADNGNSKVSRIYVGNGIGSVGEKIVPTAYIKAGDVHIELIGAYETELGSLAEFNQKQSVKDTKLVFESLKFN